MAQRRLSVAILVVCLTILVSAVGQAAATKLTYRIWDVNQQPAMKQIVTEFNKVHPEIEVEIEVTPYRQYWTSLETAAAGKNLPDLFWLNAPNFLLYSTNGMVLPLDKRIAKDKYDMHGYPKSMLDLYSYKGILYGMPKDFDTIGLWYNKELFDSAKVPYPTNNWTWDDLIQAAIKLTDAKKGVWGIAAQLDDQSGFYNTIWQAGGYVISDDRKTSGFADPRTIEGLRFWTDLIHKYKASPTQAQMTDTSPIALFEAGRVAMLSDGAWNAIRFAENDYTKKRVDVVSLPKGKQRGVTIHGLANVIAANTKHPEEAWTFLKFLGSPRAHEIQAATGTVIPAWSEYQHLWVKAHPAFNVQIFIDQVKDSFPYPVSLYTNRWAQLSFDELTRAWAGEVSIEEAAKTLARKMNELLAQE